MNGKKLILAENPNQVGQFIQTLTATSTPFNLYKILDKIKDRWGTDPLYFFFLLRNIEEQITNSISDLTPDLIQKYTAPYLQYIPELEQFNRNIILRNPSKLEKINALALELMKFTRIGKSYYYHEKVFEKVKDVHLRGITSLAVVHCYIYKDFLQQFQTHKGNAKEIEQSIAIIDDILWGFYFLSNSSIDELSLYLQLRLKSKGVIAVPMVELIHNETKFLKFLGHVKVAVLHDTAKDNVVEFNSMEKLSSSVFFNQIHTLPNIYDNLPKVVKNFYNKQLSPFEYAEKKLYGKRLPYTSTQRHQIASQVIGNCTEKSIRLMLEHILGEEVLKQVFTFIDHEIARLYNMQKLSNEEVETFRRVASLNLYCDKIANYIDNQEIIKRISYHKSLLISQLLKNTQPNIQV